MLFKRLLGVKSDKKILKIITVASSATLMVGFVAFKAGAFTGYIDTENYSPPDSLKKDSSKVEMNTHMHSSKSLIIDWPETLATDSDSTKNTDIIPSSKNDIIFDPDDMPNMGSSKSGIIFEPADTQNTNPPKDTSKKELKSNKENPNKKFNK